MTRTMIMALMLLLVVPALRADNSRTKAAEEYRKLLIEYEEEGGARIFGKRFLSFAEQHPDDPSAVRALLWVVENVRGRADAETAMKRLAEKYTQSEQLATGCYHIARARSIQAEPLLRTLIEKSPHQSVQAHACFYLAMLLDMEASIVEQLKAAPELAARVSQYYGKEYGQHLTSLDLDKLEAKRVTVFEQLRDSFGDVVLDDTRLGDVAEQRLFRIRHLSVGKVAPDIQGEDIMGRPLKLSDYRGKVVMLTFWGHW